MWYIFITRLNNQPHVYCLESSDKHLAEVELYNKHVPANNEGFWIIESYECKDKPERF